MNRFTLLASGSILAVACAIILAACGDNVENTTVNQMGMEVVASEDNLPECSEDNEGEQAVVKGESSVRVCIDGDWTSMNGSGSGDFKCTTKELKDKSGVKIICNGDSIGVVLNGEKGDAGEAGKKGEKGDDGAAGKDGAGCTVAQNDTAITVTCGDKSTTVDLGNMAKADTAELDSEALAVSLDSLAGYSQKGPFLKGSTVYLYELADGRTLKQTNGNFTSNITRDDGYYKFNSRDLVSQYALIVVDGHYRNEVTGDVSNAAIKLKAISDVHKHSAGANVNVLTHLEYERVYYLVTKKKMKVSAAKRQAQREILKQFHIELDEDMDSENMDVFGDSDADAALLAISILLQGDRSEADMMALLTEITNDIAEDGEWNDSKGKADSAKAKIADWALGIDSSGRLDSIGIYVKNWGLGDAPDYKKFVRKFWYKTYGLESCSNNSDGVIAKTKNPLSDFFDSNTRFICKNGEWRVASDLEKDRYNWDGEIKRDGTLLKGLFTGDTIVWDADTLRYAKKDELYLNKGCVSYLDNTSYTFSNGLVYFCNKSEWAGGFLIDDRDGTIYRGVQIGGQVWMAENLNYEIEGSSCYKYDADSCTMYGRFYDQDLAKIACPYGWHLPSVNEWETLMNAAGGYKIAGRELKSKTGWNNYYDMDGNGLNSLGFAVLPAGFTYGDKFTYSGDSAAFWTSAPVSVHMTSYMALGNSSDSTIIAKKGPAALLSVRCIKD